MKEDKQSKQQALAPLYPSDIIKAGTEEMNQEDYNIPSLVLLQNGTDIPGLKNKKIGSYYRTDTQEQIESPEVTFVYVTTKQEPDKKTGDPKTIKLYFGFYKDSQEPFRMKMKGWGLAAHKQLQTEIAMYQQRFQIPMFALTVKLTSENKTGVTKDGDKYNVEKIVAEIIKDATGKPVIEQDKDRIGFLYESVGRFQSIAPLAADDEETGN